MVYQSDSMSRAAFIFGVESAISALGDLVLLAMTHAQTSSSQVML